MVNLLEFEPVQKFVQVLGKDIEKYFGGDKGALVYLRPDGVWYAEGLYQWFKKKKKDITITSMEDGGEGLEEEKIRGRKALIVINESFSGKAQKRSTEAIRIRKERLNIKGIKFAAYRDRPGTADFSVDQYSAEAIWRFRELDAIDLKILQALSVNGREALADVGKKVNLSSVAVKNRLDKLAKEKVVRIEATLNIDQFYTMCAQIYIEADEETVQQLIEKFEKRQEVFMLVRVTGIYNLLVGVLGRTWQNVQDFIESEIRPNSGVRKIFISTGEVPILPKTIPPKF